MKIFLSYSQSDSFAARVIADWLEESGHSAVLFEKYFDPGEFRRQMEKHVSESDCVLFVLSKHSAYSDYCLSELQIAKKRKRPVVFARIERDAPLPKLFSTHRPIEMCPDLRSGLRKV